MPDAADLKGKPLADAVREGLRAEIAALAAGGARPLLAVVVAGADPAVLRYAEAKRRSADALGIAIEVVQFDAPVSQRALEAEIARLSAEASVNGILLELPLAEGLDAEAAIARIDPAKDVDGLTAANLGLIAAGREGRAIVPATPLACIRLAESCGPLAGRRVTVVGRGRSVGRALIPMLVNRDATVTVCHTRTRDLPRHTAAAEVLFIAAGRARLIGAEHVAPGQIVVDAGINVEEDGLVGDVDAAAVRPIVAALTPVPGGVGPLTSTLIFENLVLAATRQAQREHP
jgi:methylenetetrahydrofolate dehydrogenase (NADP+)/methenyltetrahydrofolate cyclohydrolase